MNLTLPPTGEYLIINKATGKALDANVHVARQLSNAHPRVFSWDPNQNAESHIWFVESLGNGLYMLKTRQNNVELALDGHVNVPQHDSTHPSPYLYPANSSSPNQRWVLHKTSEYGVFVVENDMNHLALDGNLSAHIPQFDTNMKSPFLYTTDHRAPNHQWVFRQVNRQPQQQWIQPQIAQQQKTIVSIPSGRYMIVNAQTGMALDGNYHHAKQLSKFHQRIFMWKPRIDAPNHHWIVESLGQGEYLISNDYKSAKQALVGNIGAPQHLKTHPQPFLHAPEPADPNARWTLVPVPTGELNVYLIVNFANGMALDGNVDSISHFDRNYRSPFLWPRMDKAPSQHWRLQMVSQHESSSTGATLAGAAIGFGLAGPLGALVGAALGKTATKRQRTEIVHTQPEFVCTYPAMQNQTPMLQPQILPPYPQPTITSQEDVTHENFRCSPQPQDIIPPQQPFAPPFEQINEFPSYAEPIAPPQVTEFKSTTAMSYNDFQGLLHSIKTEPFESYRTSLIKTASEHNWFTCDQLAQILKILSFANERMIAAQAIVPRIVDKNNSIIAIEALTFSNEKESLDQLFRKHKLY